MWIYIIFQTINVFDGEYTNNNPQQTMGTCEYYVAMRLHKHLENTK